MFYLLAFRKTWNRVVKSLQKYTKEWLEELCQSSFSYREVLSKANRKPTGGNYDVLKQRIKEYKIDVSHFTGKLWSKGKAKEADGRIVSTPKYTYEEIFCNDSKVSQHCLKNAVKNYKIFPYECNKCKCTGEWQGGIIALELHHKDGNKHNNKIENLELLCPNCHALTETYRNSKRN